MEYLACTTLSTGTQTTYIANYVRNRRINENVDPHKL